MQAPPLSLSADKMGDFFATRDVEWFLSCLAFAFLLFRQTR
jgi:hypothetical protein